MPLSNTPQKENKDKRLELSISDLKITEDGINDFFWPIAYSKLIDFGQSLEHKIAKFLREYDKQEDVLPYKMATKHFVMSICAIFQALLLKQCLKDANKLASLPPECDLWLSMFNDDVPKESPAYINAITEIKPFSNNRVLQLFKNPNSLIKKIKTLKVSKSGQFKTGNLHLKKLRSYDNENVIVATQRISLIQEHAATVSNPVYLINSHSFLSSVAQDERNALTINRMIFDTFLSIVKQVFNERDVPLPPAHNNYLSDTLENYIRTISIHMNCLQNYDNVPLNLWTGTGGNIWDTMLRCEVKRRGGTVVAHDHGGGTAHVNHPEKGWVEMWSCDEFVTYSQAQAENIQHYLPDWPCLDKKTPKISFIKSSLLQSNSKIDETPYDNGYEIKNICLLSTIYSVEDVRGFPLFPYLPYIDWQSRLMFSIKKIGYNVAFKPHPESRFSAPDYKKYLNVDVIDGRFEDIQDNYDLYIFDLTNTSTFQPTLKSNKPVLIIDFEQVEWDGIALKMLKNRCGYLKGWHDQNNRMQIDWNILADSIQDASTKRYSNEFVNKFYI